MSEPSVAVFLYGSYMNADVLRDVYLFPERFDVARLDGYDITIAPRANLLPSPLQCVYGVVTDATHTELSRLYAHARYVLGETYLPHPVLIRSLQHGWSPALCYMAPLMIPRAPDPAYIDRIIAPARKFGFPER